MRKNIYILLTASLLLTMNVSCSDFLQEENKINETSSTAYSTATGLQGLISTCYSYARGWYGKEAGLGLSEMGTDEFYYGYDNKQKSLCSYNINSNSLDDNTSDNACLDHYWELFYQAVDACNNALQYTPTNTAVSANIKHQYLGEAHFLRAFYYLHMVNIWGPIPYNSEPTTADNIQYAPTRVSEGDIYGNILADLDKSIAQFDSAGYKVKTDGRASYWAARAFKARTLLYAASWWGTAGKDNQITNNSNYSGKTITQLYALAQAEAEAVIGSGIASFYSNYEDTWSMNNEDISANKESIFGIAYSSDITSTANCIPYRNKTSTSGSSLEFNSLITRTGYSRGGNAMLLMFVPMWNNGASDLGGNGKEVFVRVLSDASSHFVTNTKTGTSVDVSATYSPYGRGFTRYLPSLYLWNLLEKHSATDQRTDATLLSAYTIAKGLEHSSKKYTLMTDTAIYYSPLNGDSEAGKAAQAWAKNRYRIQFAAGGDIPVYSSFDPAKALPTESAKATSNIYSDTRYNTYKIGGWCSYPGIKKFLDNVYDSNYPTWDISSRDAIVMRLAEMYLIKAECQLHTENGTAAMTTINQLRAERAISGTDNTLSGTADLNTILDERAIELCGEQQRWFDLKRTHTLVERVNEYNAQAQSGISSLGVNCYLRPIPQTELDAITNYSTTEGSGFWQNAGY
jgi:starch-binding outer membrane protein, SusD/RagB family